jgi:hypothetical protein
MRVGFLASGIVVALLGIALLSAVANSLAHCPALDICSANPAGLSIGIVLLVFGLVLVLLAFVLKVTSPPPPIPASPSATIPAIRCHRCGVLNAVGSVFCASCGAKL